MDCIVTPMLALSKWLPPQKRSLLLSKRNCLASFSGKWALPGNVLKEAQTPLWPEKAKLEQGAPRPHTYSRADFFQK